MRARGRAGARWPKLTEDEAALAQRLYDEREETVQQTADMFGVPPVDGLRHWARCLSGRGTDDNRQGNTAASE
ncbi:hypothetical protein AB0N06_35710 [Streptomyces sp. NPDC051020]|uniref:hypothetical protein n=1 Tax=Streptomyces sp. NPDC051020 TaxID=3155409 RepID=UPI003412BEC5